MTLAEINDELGAARINKKEFLPESADLKSCYFSKPQKYGKIGKKEQL